MTKTEASDGNYFHEMKRLNGYKSRLLSTKYFAGSGKVSSFGKVRLGLESSQIYRELPSKVGS